MGGRLAPAPTEPPRYLTALPRALLPLVSLSLPQFYCPHPVRGEALGGADSCRLPLPCVPGSCALGEERALPGGGPARLCCPPRRAG